MFQTTLNWQTLNEFFRVCLASQYNTITTTKKKIKNNNHHHHNIWLHDTVLLFQKSNLLLPSLGLLIAVVISATAL